jgi:hypothetical protein
LECSGGFDGWLKWAFPALPCSNPPWECLISSYNSAFCFLYTLPVFGVSFPPCFSLSIWAFNLWSSRPPTFLARNDHDIHLLEPSLCET